VSRFEILTVTIAVLALLPIVPVARWVDKRYVNVKDFIALKQVIYDAHVDDYEERIEKIEEDIAMLSGKDNRSEIEDAQLAKRVSRRDKYVRKLERIRA